MLKWTNLTNPTVHLYLIPQCIIQNINVHIDPDMHHGTCVTHVPWCMPGLICTFLFWMLHCRIWNRCVVGFVNFSLVNFVWLCYVHNNTRHAWHTYPYSHKHYIDVIMTTMTSQITSLTVGYSIVYSGADKKNIKAPRHWPLCGEFTGTGEFPAQMASNAENVSIWWRHHE